MIHFMEFYFFVIIIDLIRLIVALKTYKKQTKIFS